MIAPMLAYDAKGDLGVIPRDGTWIMEPKLDGWRWQVHVTPTGVRSYGGRNGVEYTGKAPAIEARLAKLPVGTVLDGELICGQPGLTSAQVSTLLARGGQGLLFVAFDVLATASGPMIGLPWSERRARLESFGALFAADDAQLCHVSPVLDVSEDGLQALLDAGMEGIVAKRKAATYRPGKRSRDTIKVKPQTTADGVVIGWVYGEGASNREVCGAIRVRMENGCETTMRFDATPDEADAVIGMPVEFSHYGLMESGLPRHPVKPRIRVDLVA